MSTKELSASLVTAELITGVYSVNRPGLLQSLDVASCEAIVFQTLDIALRPIGGMLACL